ncbi:predicted protein [Plenodomus lingam JN3]|uniref:Predicted protein n=1 Tax=Leptosphaeria maculans (strain JN3 / isolate v23.1.3 / race Av1-4-5-6-7-8) TaxID=985895 RepID=E4ZPQ1_LEPMJ|nr:predicted protein [Plenodomus lingam JN3]CBX93436.1 predicted protein [Plenodomus lingam JN3]
MNESFAFWFPLAWTMVGAIFTVLSFLWSVVPAPPVLLEILTELRKMTKGHPKIHRRLEPFSLKDFLKTQAKVLARERTQTTPNPFIGLD